VDPTEGIYLLVQVVFSETEHAGCHKAKLQTAQASDAMYLQCDVLFSKAYQRRERRMHFNCITFARKKNM
jgi:hypothetical protein